MALAMALKSSKRPTAYFRQAIAEDPGFARAYAALGDKAQWRRPWPLDPNLSDAHALVSRI